MDSWGNLSGAAKFLSFGDGSNSSWDGLVDLSEIAYSPSTQTFGGASFCGIRLALCGIIKTRMKRKKIFYSAFLIAAFLISAGAFTANAGTCTTAYCDSDVTSTITSNPPKSEPYTLSCQTVGSNILVFWTGTDYTVGTTTVYGNTDNESSYYTVYSWTGSSALGNGSRVDATVAPGHSVNYWLVLDYVGGGSSNRIVSSPSRCSVGSIAQQSTSVDAPTNLEAFAYDANSIYLTWGNNVLGASSSLGYSFQIQRANLSPAPPNSLFASPVQQNNGAMAAVISWTQFTNPLIDAGDTYVDIQRSASFTFDADVENFVASSSPYTDRSASENTTYYYRIRNCLASDISPYYTANNATDNRGQMTFNNSYFSSSTCSDYAAMKAVDVGIAPPTGLTAKWSGPLNQPVVNLRWTNNSSAASGIEIRRDLMVGGGGAPPVTVDLPSGAISYDDTNVGSYTGYSYSVYAYTVSNGKKVYSPPATASIFITYDNIGNKVAASLSRIVEGVKGMLSSIGNDINRLVASVSRAFAAEQTNSTPFDNQSGVFQDVVNTTSSVYMDTALQADTIYLYRARVLYNGAAVSGWSNVAASRTLAAGAAVGSDTVKLCAANNVCKTVQRYDDRNSKKSENECAVNADCANVGNSSQIFQEK